ncbi:MAG: hypothetical protein ACXQTS_02525 [Candidatus Methanospirareceae archaeon]
MEREDLLEMSKMFVGLTLLPMKASLDFFAGLAKYIEKTLPTEPERVMESLVDMEMSALKALDMLIEMRLKLLEEYKSKSVKKERKESVRVE